jgi:hypothetical protein
MIKTLSPTTYSPPVPRVSAVSLATEIHRGSALYSLVHRDYKRHLSDAEASITQGHKGRLLSFITGVGKRRCVSPMSESATIRSNIDRRTEGRLSVLIRRKPSNYSQISDLGVFSTCCPFCFPERRPTANHSEPRLVGIIRLWLWNHIGYCRPAMSSGYFPRTFKIKCWLRRKIRSKIHWCYPAI